METTMADLRSGLVRDLGTTDWFKVSQALINDFSRLTTDDQWIHVDRERAASGPFGTTIAHGYLMVSLLSQFLDELLVVSDRILTVNYGIDRLRFTGPVRSETSVRCRMTLESVREKGDDIIAAMHCVVESDDSAHPVLVADILFLFR